MQKMKVSWLELTGQSKVTSENFTTIIIYNFFNPQLKKIVWQKKFRNIKFNDMIVWVGG